MTVDAAVAALAAGRLVVLPTDTVYGIAADAGNADAVAALSRAKRRDPAMPIALVAASVDELVACVPELRGRPERIARALLPGPWTLVLPNPARRLPWLVGARPDTIGVRVPAVEGVALELLTRAGGVAATSANLHGGTDPRRVEDVPDELRALCAAVVDAGDLPGTASTVVDFTGDEPVVLRVGAGDPEDALRAATSSA